MTNDEKLEMLALMRQAIKEEVPPIVREIVRTETADLRADVAGLKTDVSTLKTDVSALKTDVSALKTDVAGLKTDVAGLKEKSLEFDRELSAINENVQYLIDATAREFRETKSNFGKMEARFDKLEIRLDNLEARIAGLERRFSSLENQMKWATDAILDLRADLKKHQQEHQNFLTKEDLLKLESRVDRLEAQLVKLLENN